MATPKQLQKKIRRADAQIKRANEEIRKLTDHLKKGKQHQKSLEAGIKKTSKLVASVPKFNL